MTGMPGRHAGISSANAPALDLPARFMVLGMVGLALAAIVAPWAWPLLGGNFYAPHLLAFTHLNTIGVIAAVVVGASYQLVPVVLQIPLSSVRLGRVSFWLLLPGLLLFLPGLFTTWRPGLAIGSSLVFAGLLVYLAVMLQTLRQAPRLDVVGWHIALSLVGLGGGVVLGLLLALNKGVGFLGTLTLPLLAGHATLMIGGWVAVLLGGVAYRLAGMFTLSEDRLWTRVAWVELALSCAGAWSLALALALSAPRPVLVASAMLLVGGQALFGIQLVHLYRVRRRRGFDVHIPFALVAVASGVGAAVLLAASLVAGVGATSRLWTLVVWLALAGLLETAIQGFFYKIATFLVWLHRYAPRAGRQKVPRLEELYDQRLAKAGWALWTGALVLSIPAVLTGREDLGMLAGMAATAGLAAFLTNVTKIATHRQATGAGETRRVLGHRQPRTQERGKA